MREEGGMGETRGEAGGGGDGQMGWMWMDSRQRNGWKEWHVEVEDWGRFEVVGEGCDWCCWPGRA